MVKDNINLSGEFSILCLVYKYVCTWYCMLLCSWRYIPLSLPLQPWQTSMSNRSRYMLRSLVWLDSSARSMVCQSLSSAGRKTAVRWTPRTRGWTKPHHGLALIRDSSTLKVIYQASLCLFPSILYVFFSLVGTLFCPQVFCRLQECVTRTVESSAVWPITVQEWNTVPRHSSLFQVVIFNESHIYILWADRSKDTNPHSRLS